MPSKSADMSAERSETSSDSTRSLTTCEGENMHGSKPEAWYESNRSPDKPDRSPDSTDTSNKSLDTVDISDKLPDTKEDTLPGSTKGRVIGSSDTSPRSTVKSSMLEGSKHSKTNDVRTERIE
jgi:hypothetical protein